MQLPGFAGAAAADPLPEDFLPAMRDELLAYAKAQKLQQPAVIGHSLGGVLALQMAIAAPDAVGETDSIVEDGQSFADGNLITASGGTDANTSDGVADTRFV